MSGFENDIVFAKNGDFTAADNQNVSESNGLVTNGQLWIGSTALNAGGTHINVGTLTSPLGTLTIGYSSPNITLDLVGGTTAVDSIAMQTGTNPVTPNAAGLWTFNGAVVAAGTNPVRTDGTGPNTTALEVQISQAIASTNATNIGLSAFNSAHFSCDANGFVSYLGPTVTKSVVAQADAVSLTTGVTADLTSISLTAGTWYISAIGMVNATLITNMQVAVNTTSATLPTNLGDNYAFNGGANINSATINAYVVTPAMTTTYYLVCRANATGTVDGWGNITAFKFV